MKQLLTLLLALTFVLPASAQSDLAWRFVMTPKAGQKTEFVEALREHAQWRKDHDDPWDWGVYETINGNGLAQFTARSGGHTWADFDAYQFEGADAHFEATVRPFLASETSVITAGDTTNVHWPEWSDEATLYWIVDYDIAQGKMEEFTKAIGLIHKAVVENDHPTYYYFEYTVNGGDRYDVRLVLPARSFSEFGGGDPTMESMLVDFYSQIGLEAIQEMFNEVTVSTRTSIVAHRPDLSVD